MANPDTNNSDIRADLGPRLNAREFSISEADRLLEALAVPVNQESRQRLSSLGADADRKLELLVTDTVAEELWADWNSDQRERIGDPRFRHSFRTMLADGARLGFRTDRFRSVSRSLPDPTGSDENWMDEFEDAIAGRDKCRISLRLAPERYLAFVRTNAEGAKESWRNSLSMMKDGLFYELGIILPPITVAPDETLALEEFSAEWNDVSWPKGKGLPDNRILVNDTPERLRLLDIKGEPTSNPANGNQCAVVDAALADRCEQAGLTTWNAMGYTILALSVMIRRNAAAFVNRYLVWYCLELLSQVRPVLIDHVRERFHVDVLVRVLRGLVDEDLTIRDLSSLLENMLSLQGKIPVDGSKYVLFDFDSQYAVGMNQDDISTYNLFTHNAFPAALTTGADDKTLKIADYIRSSRASLRRYISHRYTRGQNTLIVYVVDTKVDARLRDPAEFRPEEHAELLKRVREAVGDLAPDASRVVITTFESRLRLRSEIRHEFPNLPVLSYQDLSPDLNIQPIGQISSDYWSGTDVPRDWEDDADQSESPA